MAGEVNVWEGDATAVAQVETWTVGGTWNGTTETLTTTLTAEDGTTQAVVTTPTVTAAADVRNAHLADLQASAQTLFVKITFASSGAAAITATAKIAGEPFYAALSEDAGSGTYTDATTTASAGPNDFNTAANWSRGSVPVDTELVKANQGSSDILYGLDQSSIQLRGFHVGQGFKGSIGQPENSYYLKIDVDRTTSSNTPRLVIDGSGAAYWFSGTITNCLIRRTGAGAKAVRLAGDIDNLYVTGAAVKGTIDCKASMTLDNVYVAGSPSAKVVLNTGISSLDIIDMNSGEVDNYAAVATSVTMAGGIYKHRNTAGTLPLLDVWGGVCKYIGDDTITAVNVYGGTFTLEESEEDDLTITASNIYGGIFRGNGPIKVTYTANPNKYGGFVEAPAVFTLEE